MFIAFVQHYRIVLCRVAWSKNNPHIPKNISGKFHCPQMNINCLFRSFKLYMSHDVRFQCEDVNNDANDVIMWYAGFLQFRIIISLQSRIILIKHWNVGSLHCKDDPRMQESWTQGILDLVKRFHWNGPHGVLVDGLLPFNLSSQTSVYLLRCHHSSAVGNQLRSGPDADTVVFGMLTV